MRVLLLASLVLLLAVCACAGISKLLPIIKGVPTSAPRVVTMATATTLGGKALASIQPNPLLSSKPTSARFDASFQSSDLASFEVFRKRQRQVCDVCSEFMANFIKGSFKYDLAARKLSPSPCTTKNADCVRLESMMNKVYSIKGDGANNVFVNLKTDPYTAGSVKSFCSAITVSSVNSKFGESSLCEQTINDSKNCKFVADFRDQKWDLPPVTTFGNGNAAPGQNWKNIAVANAKPKTVDEMLMELRALVQKV